MRLSFRLSSLVLLPPLLLLALGLPVDARPLFPGRYYQAAPRTFFVTGADINEDGIEDLIATGWDMDAVSILLGVGGGEFEPEQRYPVNRGAFITLIRDFDSDGHLDLVIATQINPSVVLLRGQGDGTFLPQETLATSGYPWGMETADLDGDGHLDLAVAGLPSGGASILHGNGDGTFYVGQVLSIGGYPSALILAELDNDGRTDLLLANDTYNNVQLFHGLGDGTFAPLQTFAVGLNPESMILADLNADGIPDLSVANTGSNDVSVLMGAAGTVFSFETRFAVGEIPASILADDFDHDGTIDLITANVLDFNLYLKGGDVSLLRGQGTGLFAPEERIEAGLNPAWLYPSDIDSDGRTDIVVANTAGRVSILFDDGSVPRRSVPIRIEASNLYANDIQGDFEIADVTGDGLLDLVVRAFPRGSSNFGYATIYQGNPDLTFVQRDDFFIGSVGIQDLDVGDFDADGLTDFVAAGPLGILDFRYSRGDGTFELFRFHTADRGPVVVDDFNEDGLDDLWTLITDGPSRGWTTILSRGRGNFEVTAGIPGTVCCIITEIRTADFNRDGHRDVIVSKYNPYFNKEGEFLIFLGRGDGTFEDQRVVTLPFWPLPLSIGDINGDGIADIVAAGALPPDFFDETDVGIFLGNGDGTFSDVMLISPNEDILGVLVGDFDSDGILDLVRQKRGSLLLQTGLGSLQFGDAGTYEGPLGFSGPRSADLDGDGRKDLVTLSDDEILIYLNDGPFPPGRPHAVAAFVFGCPSISGQEILLSGEESADGDSTPGTNDDIADFEWFEVTADGDRVPLGHGETHSVVLQPGSHVLRLVVTDTTQLSDEADLEIFINDTNDEEVVLMSTPAVLWPPNHRLVPVSVGVSPLDGCVLESLVLLAAQSNEPADSPGPGDGATKKDIQDATIGTEDLSVSLRAERDGSGTGRYYTLRYEAVDHLGNTIPLEVVVTVPHNVNGVVAPLDLIVTDGAAGTRVDWGPVNGALFYNVVRGRIAALKEDTDRISLGSLDCVEAHSLDTSTTGGHDDPVTPAVGEVFFYLVEYNDGLLSSFGAEDVPLPRVGGAGGCSQPSPVSGGSNRDVWIK